MLLGKTASPPVCQCHRCRSWWFWLQMQPGELSVHPVTLRCTQAVGSLSHLWHYQRLWRLWTLTLLRSGVLLAYIWAAVSWPASACSAGPGRSGSFRALALAAVLGLSIQCFSITQGNPVLNKLLWVLAVSFQCFLGQEFLACQCEQILGNPCFDLSGCWVCFVCCFFFFPFWFCNAVSKLNRACFINAHCHVMQQWKSLVRKVSQCMCPKEASASVFKQDITRHLATPKEQACFFLHARLGMVSWQSKEDSTMLLFSTCPFW